jgi:hypothetical protein
LKFEKIQFFTANFVGKLFENYTEFKPPPVLYDETTGCKEDLESQYLIIRRGGSKGVITGSPVLSYRSAF